MASKKQELVVEVTTKADQAKRDLDQLDKKAKEIGDKPIEVPIKVDADQAKAQLDTTARAAGGAKNAFANLVGNTAQDLGNLAGPLGSVGVALGQVAEYTADAANEGGGLKSALAGAASMAGPMLALAAAGIAVNKVVGDMQKKSQEAKEANKAFLDSMVEGTGILEGWTESLEDAGSGGELLNKFFADTLDKTGDLEKTTTAFGQMGMTIDDLGQSIIDADAGFRQQATTFAQQRGFSAEVADAIARIVSQEEKLEDVTSRVQTEIFPMIPPEERGKALALAEGLEQLNDVVEKLDTEKKAEEFIALARAIPGMTEAVDKATAAGGSQIEMAGRVAGALRDQKTAQEEAGRAAEEGARLAQESGTIIDQVGRQVATASDLAEAAYRRAKQAQDDWFLEAHGAQAQVDDVTSAIGRLKDATDKQAEAAAAGTQTTKDKILSDIALRDAMAAITSESIDVVEGFKEQGLTADQARQKQNELAQQQYDLAIQMGLPAEAAALIRDNINAIKPSVTTEVEVTERGYNEVKRKKDDLEKDTESTHYIYGVLDRSVVNAVAALPPGSIPGSGRAVTPAAGPAAVPLGVGALAAPAATVAPSRAVSVNVNLSGAIVADTFQLQRVVSRAVRQGVRLNGARRYG